MSIVRVSHSKDRPYVMLNKSALEDKRLSWEAKGLWAYLLSRPDNWQVSIAHLCTIFMPEGKKNRGCGLQKMKKIINELIDQGYMEREQERHGTLFGKVNYVVHEEKLKKCLPRTAFPLAGDQPLTIKDYKEDISSKNDNHQIPSISNPSSSSELPSSFASKITVFFDPKTYKLRDGSCLSLRAIRAFEKYSGDAQKRLISNVRWYEMQMDKGTPVKTTHEQFLQWAINKNMAGREEAAWQNALYAQLMKEEYNLRNMIILKTKLQLKSETNGMSESIDLSLPVETFSMIVDKFVKANK